MSTLVVVESPSKAKKIGKMLGPNYVVQASIGHIRDLPTRLGEIGFDATTLKPIYELTESGKKTSSALKARYEKCDAVLLATDPDREGEAIAWHVAEVLKIPASKRLRVKFHEITNTAVMAAVRSPAPLETLLVLAQAARRVVDRMVGWLVSGPLSDAIKEKASAGRVQSPSMGLIVEQERAIRAFVSEQFFTASVSFAGGWSADWVVGTGTGDGKKSKVHAEASKAAGCRTFMVLDFVERDEYEAPPAPFDTALMQQAASVALGFDPDRTMAAAQRLFQGLEEGHGFITYHRTDETNISDEAFSMIQTYASKRRLPVIDHKRTWKAAEGAQEAHEAIRPTDFEVDVGGLLSGDDLALYKLIHRRAVMSQLPDVVHSVRRVMLDGNGLDYPAVGRVLKDKGWRGFGEADEVEVDDDTAPEKPNPVPYLDTGDELVAVGGQVVDGWTRAPSRYTKAALVKTLKALGIGRPATYSAAVDGLEKRGYVTLNGRFLVPTAKAEKIYDALKGKFAFIEVGFTRELEEALDAITSGRRSYDEVVRAVFGVLQRELLALGGARAPSPALHTPVKREMAVNAGGEPVICPKCGKGMVLRNGAKGPFYGCSGYPGCKTTKAMA